jgi:WD repeat-containing protein 23
MSAGWHSERGGTVIARHAFKGLSKLPGGLEDWAEKKRLERSEAEASPQRRRYHIPGRYYGSSDVDDD